MHLALQILSLGFMLSSATLDEGSPCHELCVKCDPLYQFNIEDESEVFSGCSAFQVSEVNATSSRSSSTSSLKILDLSNVTTLHVHQGAVHPQKHDFNWRLSNVSYITFSDYSFVDAHVNIYVRKSEKLTIHRGAFVNCRGTLFLLEVDEARMDERAFSEGSDVTVVLSKSKLSVGYRQVVGNSDFAVVFRPVREVEVDADLLEDSVFPVLATVYTTLVLCVVVAILLLVILLTMKKLFRRNFESVKLKPLNKQLHNAENFRQDAPLPRPPRHNMQI